MAEIKISALTSAISLTGAEAVPVVQAGATRKTTTQDIANLMSAAVNAVSNAVSVERTARNADIAALSVLIADVISAGGGGTSVTSAEAGAISAQAASANAVLVTSVQVLSDALSKEISNRVSADNTASAKTFLGLSVRGHQSIANALSDRISATVAGAFSVTSAEVQVASAAATSANNHANTVSVAVVAEVANRNSAINVLSVLHQSLSATVSGMTVQLSALSIQVSVLSINHTSLANVVSGIIAAGGGGVSVTSAEANAISAQAAFAINVVSAVLANEISARTASIQTLSTLVNAVSIAVVNEVNNRISAALIMSDRVSIVSVAVAAEATRAIAAENAFSILLSAAAINTFSAFSTTNNNISILEGRLSTLSANFSTLVNRVSANSATGGGSGSVTSTELSQAVSALNLVSSRTTAAVSVKGLQNAVNALSGRISAIVLAANSVTSSEAQAISTQAASAINVVSASLAAISLNASAISTRLSALSSQVSLVSLNVTSADTHAGTASAAATSADTHANAASVAATSVDNRVNTLIDRVSANSAALSLLQSLVNNALSAGDVMSNTFSVFSAGMGRPQLRMVTGGINTISAAALTNISGLSISVAANGIYQVKAVLIHGHSTQATNGFGFGVSSPAATVAAGKWVGFTSVVAAGTASANYGFFNQAGFNSITYSATPAASATMYRTELDLLLVSVAAGTVQLMARTSAATTGAIDIQIGSYVQAFRIG